MKKDTFATVLAMCRADPLTDQQLAIIKPIAASRLVPTSEAAEMLGVSTRTLKRMHLRTCRVNGRQNQYYYNDLQNLIASKTF